jgi:hypothetical protein
MLACVRSTMTCVRSTMTCVRSTMTCVRSTMTGVLDGNPECFAHVLRRSCEDCAHFAKA